MTQVVTPRRAATVMVLRDSAIDAHPSLEVLLLRRSADTPFVPGAHVFPGGAVDDGDHHEALDAVVVGLDDTDASRVLGIASGGRAAWVAAVRECLEEAGILLAVHADGTPIAGDHPVLAEVETIRRAVEGGRRGFATVYADHGLHLPLDRLVYVAQWITPEVSPRRYDTRFFAMTMPPDQGVRVDDWEAVSAAWWTPTAALDAWRGGEIDLIEPTVSSLELLRGFATTADAIASLRAGADTPTRIHEPAGGIRVPLLSELRGDLR